MGKQVKFVLNLSNNLTTESTYTITISNYVGEQKFYTRTTQNRIAICCCGCDFIVNVLCENGEFSQTLTRFVPCAPCELIMNFSFNFILPQLPTQNFVLLDRTYGFPIKSANLIFKSH